MPIGSECLLTMCACAWLVMCVFQCSSDCGEGTRERTVTCTNPQGLCDPLSQPTLKEPCEDHSKCYEWKTGDWSKVADELVTSTQLSFFFPTAVFYQMGLWFVLLCLLVKPSYRLISPLSGWLYWLFSTWLRFNGILFLRVISTQCKQALWPTDTSNRVLQCSSSCGKGLQSRVVQCMHKVTGRHGNECPVTSRPPTYRPCHQGTCNEKVNVNTITSPRLGETPVGLQSLLHAHAVDGFPTLCDSSAVT